jgi:hypothetical protein
MPKINFIFYDGSVKEVEAFNGLSVMEIAHKNSQLESKGESDGLCPKSEFLFFDEIEILNFKNKS